MKLINLCPACLTELPADYDGDHVRIDRAIAGQRGLFLSMTEAEQAEVINTALTRGLDWSKLSRLFMVSVHNLQRIAGGPADDFDQQVRELYDQGLSDSAIATRLGVGPTKVFQSRRRQKLPSLFGPGGRPIKRELVPA